MTTNEQKSLQSVAKAGEALRDKSKVYVTVGYKDELDEEDARTDIEIYRCKVKNAPTVVGFLSSIFQVLGIKKLGDLPSVDFTDASLFFQLMSSMSTQIFVVAAELCELKQEEMQDLELDDALKVVMKIFDVNKDFFLNSVLPIVQFALPVDQASQAAVTKKEG